MLARSEPTPRFDEVLAERELPVCTRHRLITRDARCVTPAAIGPVDLVVTSPPYWTIIDYGSSAQIGFGQSLTEYLSDLERVWRTCHNALQEGSRLVVNIGDQYLRATKGTPYQIVPLHALLVNSISHLAGGTFLYMGSIVWRKVSTTKPSGGASVMGSYPFPRAVYPCFENEYLAIFRKGGKATRPSPTIRELAKLTLEEWRLYTQGVWSVPGARMDENPAAFPEDIPERFIRMFTFPGETVLDPFAGSGTTMASAAAWGRNSVGIELGFKTASGRRFEKVIEDRIRAAKPKASYVGPRSFEIAHPSR